MGFFSAKCKCCGLGILSMDAVLANRLPNHEWMTKVVAVFPSNPGQELVMEGDYNGYGSIVSDRFITDNLWNAGFTKWPDMYHKACWVKAGSPKDFRGGSKDDPEQGFFLTVENYIGVKEPKGASHEAK